ncbi:hypothetical protein [Actinosynnema sp. NPDC023587]|uniref:hypothetical protein n=1 Tax=Actinosynnema sp. NPDC023587 TaxID=3154695 RepID=UPI00340B6170
MAGWFRRRRRTRPGNGTPVEIDQAAVDSELARLPQQTSREVAQDWLRGLTLLGEGGRTLQETLDLITEVNQVRAHVLALEGPLSARDSAVLLAGLEWTARARSRQAGVNLLVEGLLIEWLCQATGRTRTHVVQQLALEIDRRLPLEQPHADGDTTDPRSM